MSTYALFTDAYPPIMDGVGVMVRNYARCLSQMEHRPVVVAPRVPGYAETDPFEVLRTCSMLLPPKKPYRVQLPAFSPGVKSSLREMSPQLAHAHSPASAGAMALALGRGLGIPVVSTFHSKLRDDFYQVVHNQRIAGFATSVLMRHYAKVDSVWTVSQGTALTLQEYGYQGRVDVIPNGCDLKGQALARQEARARILRDWQIPPQEPLLLYVGQMARVKNPMLVIRVAARLFREGIPGRLVMAGEGPQLQALRALAQTQGIADRVVFTGVLRDRERLRALYAGASLFVFPSRYDNAPLVVREAAAMRCPALLLSGTNAAEGVVHGENGFIAMADTDDAFADALRSALSEPLRLAKAGEAAERTLAFSWETVVGDVLDRYREICREYAARPTRRRLSAR